MPLSVPMQRAMKETDRKLRQLGYDVVPFFLTDDVWDQQRDFMFACLANGIVKDAFKDSDDACESLVLNIWPINFLLGTGGVTRFFVNGLMKYFLGLGRAAKNCRAFVQHSPANF